MDKGNAKDTIALGEKRIFTVTYRDPELQKNLRHTFLEGRNFNFDKLKASEEITVIESTLGFRKAMQTVQLNFSVKALVHLHVNNV